MNANKPLATFHVEVANPIDFEGIKHGARRAIPITGGTVSGPLGDGVILAGTDWQRIDSDETIYIDAHYAIQLNDGSVIEIESTGIRAKAGTPDVYFRTVIRMTAPEPHSYLNQRIYAAIGRRLEREVLLDLFPID